MVMDSVRRKRKGIQSSSSSSIVGRKRFYHGDEVLMECRRKKCREEEEDKSGVVENWSGSCKKKRDLTAVTVMTAPPCGGSSSVEPGRGLKRKLGCLESATRTGRRKKLENEYVLGPVIGKGKFGSVKLCRSKATGDDYACKTLPKNGGEIVHREIEIMQHLSGHPGVVMLKEVFEDSDSYHLVMEMCSGGRLLDQMATEGTYSEHRAANVLKEVVSVIRYCHDMGVVHRDVKPENILLTALGKVKLADFGLAMRITNGQKLTGLAGSPAYVAPEVLSGYYSEKVDVWGAGVMLHALLVGTLPFHGDSHEAILEAIKNNDLNFHSGLWMSISVLARDLISQMLTRDVSARMTADEVLVHPWILFYTECPSKAIPIKSTSRNNVTNNGAAQMKKVVETDSNPSHDAGELEEDDFVDVLAAAVNRVTISETKRTRLCVPSCPMEQQCSSNLKTNLLAAF